jgi:hypothetical protein
MFSQAAVIITENTESTEEIKVDSFFDNYSPVPIFLCALCALCGSP